MPVRTVAELPIAFDELASGNREGEVRFMGPVTIDARGAVLAFMLGRSRSGWWRDTRGFEREGTFAPIVHDGMNFDPGGLRLSSDPNNGVPLSMSPEGFVLVPATLPLGPALFVSGPDGTLRLVAHEGSETATGPPISSVGPAVLDERGFVAMGNDQGLWVEDADGLHLRQALGEAFTNITPHLFHAGTIWVEASGVDEDTNERFNSLLYRDTGEGLTRIDDTPFFRHVLTRAGVCSPRDEVPGPSLVCDHLDGGVQSFHLPTPEPEALTAWWSAEGTLPFPTLLGDLITVAQEMVRRFEDGGFVVEQTRRALVTSTQDAVRVTVEESPSQSIISLAVSPEGRIAYIAVETGLRTLYLLDPTGVPIRLVGQGDEDFRGRGPVSDVIVESHRSPDRLAINDKGELAFQVIYEDGGVGLYVAGQRPLDPEADLSIEEEATFPFEEVGQYVTRVSIINQGPDVLLDGELEVTPLDNVRLRAPSSGPCALEEASVRCRFEGAQADNGIWLRSGESISVPIDFDVLEPGAFALEARVSHALTDTDPDNNTLRIEGEHVVMDLADMSVEEVGVDRGAPLTFSVPVRNIGTQVAEGVSLYFQAIGESSDAAGITYVSIPQSCSTDRDDILDVVLEEAARDDSDAIDFAEMFDVPGAVVCQLGAFEPDQAQTLTLAVQGDLTRFEAQVATTSPERDTFNNRQAGRIDDLLDTPADAERDPDNVCLCSGFGSPASHPGHWGVFGLLALIVAARRRA